MRHWIPILVVCVLGCSPLENRMVYHPRSFDVDEPAAADVQDVVLDSASGAKIHARYRVVPKSQGAILYCPGNAGNLQNRQAKMRTLGVELLESVLVFDYPGYGKSEGTPSEQGCYDAALAAYQWLVREQRIPPERIILYGESLGGGVAVDLATKVPHGALVLERTFTSVPDVADYQMPLFLGYWLMSNRFDSLAKIPQCRRPIFIAAGEKDALIPMRQAEQLKRAATAPTELFVLKGMGHNDPLPPEYFSALRTFLVQNANLGWRAE